MTAGVDYNKFDEASKAHNETEKKSSAPPLVKETKQDPNSGDEKDGTVKAWRRTEQLTFTQF
eukprot:gene23654-29894_t